MKNVKRSLLAALITAPALFLAVALGYQVVTGQPIGANTLLQTDAASGSAPAIRANGQDANISINIVPKGTGTVQVNGVPLVAGSTPTFTSITVTGGSTLTGGSLSTIGLVPTLTATLKSPPLRIFHATNEVTTVGVAEETAYTYSLPAGALAADGQMLRFDVWSLVNAGGGNKQLRVKFGATTISDSTLAAFANNALMQVTCYLFRTGAATQKSLCVGTDGVNGTLANGAATNTWKNLSTPGETLSGAVTILVTQQTSVAAQLTSKFASIDWYPQGQ